VPADRSDGRWLALHLLAKDGLIQPGRGTILITDRRGLERISNGAYGKAEAEFQRLFR
jgi:hypothetical protein